MKKAILLFLSVVALHSCSNNTEVSVPTPISQLEPTVTTESPTYYPAGATFHGTIPYKGSEGYFRKGFCWSTSPNPTIVNNVVLAFGTEAGSFTGNQEYSLTFEVHTTYSVRAFVQRTPTSEPIYGVNVVFTTP
jgi:hypothetical protein